jgi:hypothetical protein
MNGDEIQLGKRVRLRIEGLAQDEKTLIDQFDTQGGEKTVDKMGG